MISFLLRPGLSVHEAKSAQLLGDKTAQKHCTAVVSNWSSKGPTKQEHTWFGSARTHLIWISKNTPDLDQVCSCLVGMKTCSHMALYWISLTPLLYSERQGRQFWWRVESHSLVAKYWCFGSELGPEFLPKASVLDNFWTQQSTIALQNRPPYLFKPSVLCQAFRTIHAFRLLERHQVDTFNFLKSLPGKLNYFLTNNLIDEASSLEI